LTHNVYNYHKWGVNPGNMISDYLFRGIKQSNSFKAVFPYSSSTAALYTINGHVDEFYELDTKNGWEAHLALTITLLSEIEKDDLKKICFQKSYSSSKKCLKKNPRSLAGAMSRAASEITSEIIKDVYKALKRLDAGRSVTVIPPKAGMLDYCWKIRSKYNVLFIY